jgi:hypothetical protein
MIVLDEPPAPTTHRIDIALNCREGPLQKCLRHPVARNNKKLARINKPPHTASAT